MFHIVRNEYGYTDEYILDKTMVWLKTTIDIIFEDRYNRDMQLAQLVQLHIWQLLAWWKKIKIPTWQSIKGKTKEEQWMSDTELSKFWIWK